MAFNVLFSTDALDSVKGRQVFLNVDGRWRTGRSVPALLKECRNDICFSRALSILNKCFASVPSLLFITNKYLSTESLAPCCFTDPLFRSPACPFSPSPPLSASFSSLVAECALQLSRVLGGSWWLVPMCQAPLLCVPYSLPSPEALIANQRLHCGLPKTMPFYCSRHLFPSALFCRTQ